MLKMGEWYCSAVLDENDSDIKIVKDSLFFSLSPSRSRGVFSRSDFVLTEG